jgi:hypothetical protein
MTRSALPPGSSIAKNGMPPIEKGVVDGGIPALARRDALSLLKLSVGRVHSLNERYPGEPWISFQDRYLPSLVGGVGAKCFDDKFAARSKCLLVRGCGGINRQADECGGSGWTLRGSATPITQEAPACLGAGGVCMCEVLNRGAMPALPRREAPTLASSTAELLWFGGYFVSFTVGSALRPDLDLVRSMKDTFSLFLAMMTVWYLTLLCSYHRVLHRLSRSLQAIWRQWVGSGGGGGRGASGVAGGLSLGAHAGLVVAAALYTDWMSGALHVVLDNPILNTWPVIGPEARAFQSHHFDPTGVARG